jgi:hypothetical protein
VVRQYAPQDYGLIKSWWEARSFPAIAPTFLPKTGFIVENHAVGFLYRTDSALAWMEWITTNPESDKIERDKALNLLIETLFTEAKRLGHSVLFTSVQDAGLIERYQRHGFALSEGGMSNMVKVV